MLTVKRIGEIEPSSGLVDYIVEGAIYYPEYYISCRIGYFEDISPDGELVLRATYLFIEDQVTSEGYHHYKETISLEYDNNYLVLDEEV